MRALTHPYFIAGAGGLLLMAAGMAAIWFLS